MPRLEENPLYRTGSCFSRVLVSAISPELIHRGFFSGFSLLLLTLSRVLVRRNPEGERLGKTLEESSVTQLPQLKPRRLLTAKRELRTSADACFQSGRFPPALPLSPAWALHGSPSHSQKASSDYFPSKTHNLHVECFYFPNHSELGKRGNTTSVSI